MPNNESTNFDSGVQNQDPQTTTNDADFRSLVMYLADHIGRQHIPVHDTAVDIHELLGADAVHHELIKRIIRCIYKANRCGHLNAEVSQDATFKALGIVRKELASSQFTDIDQIHLLECVGDACKFWFAHSRRDKGQESVDTAVSQASAPGVAKVVTLSRTG